MLGVMIRKIWHKKWMFICLLLGSILLTATASSFPMYKNAVFNRMLQDEFSEHLEENGTWPTRFDMIMVSKKNDKGVAMTNMEKFTRGLYSKLDVTEKETVMYYALASADAHTTAQRESVKDFSIRLSFLSNLPDHVRMVEGQMYSETGLTEDGIVEVVVSEKGLTAMKMVVGEVFEFRGLKGADGNALRIKVVGVFEEDDADDFYWQVNPDEMQMMAFMNEDLFRSYYTLDNAKKYTITCRYFALFEYEDIRAEAVDDLIQQTAYYAEESTYKGLMQTPDYLELLREYKGKESRISTTLFILQVPVMLLLCAFLMMITTQMYEMENNDISVLKSRGASRGQIFRLYLYQSLLLTGIGAAVGLPLGNLFTRILGSANNFLEFGIRRELNVVIDKEVLIYTGIAVAISVGIMTIPALKHSKLTIVKLKRQKALKKRSWWEKCFLDIIFTGIAIYGYYNFTKHSDNLLHSALKGEALDPLLYVSSSLFILGTGMLLLRLQPVLTNLIFMIGRKRWKPASYASFMETIKNGRKQQYIMLFMILTVSLGMFNAVSARTILQNSLNNKEYVDGADLIVQETWKDNSAFLGSDPSIEFQYYEPDYGKYSQVECAKLHTKVLNESKGYVAVSNNERQNTQIMGIHTREFGEITKVKDALLEEPYRQYLNDLADDAEGILCSSDYRTNLGYKVGDYVVFYNEKGSKARGKIVGFFDYWPTYEPETITLDENNEITKTQNYLIVAHLSVLQKYWGITPYQVWFKLNENATTDSFYTWMKENKVSLKFYQDRAKDLNLVIEDPLLQGMNGVLTMSFIVMILLCAVGYLIYWIMSIRSREMIFGVLRAFGMHKGEVFHMLVNEQIFSGIYSIAAGLGIGTLSYRMFVPILQMAYSTTSQVLPLEMITKTSDMVRLYSVVGMTMAICLGVLATLVFKLNITKALKLGEE